MIYKIKHWYGAVEQEIRNDALEIIYFLRNFEKYDHVGDLDLLNYLRPFIDNRQFKLFRNEGVVSGYVSWAFFDDLNQHIFKKIGTPHRINSGHNAWIIDVVSTDNVKNQVKWLFNYFRNKYGINKKINYIRVDQYNNICTVGSKYTKEYHRWAE